MLYPASGPNPQERARLARLRGLQRGFSLIELIVVVIIVSVLAVLAIPSITARMRDRRTQQAAGEVMNLYRMARMRAMGRGSAVLVRYDASSDPVGRLELREAVRGTGTNASCNELPVSSCLMTNWAAGSNQSKLLSQFNPGIRAEYSGVRVEMTANAQLQQRMDVCFTPMGRAFVRFDQAAPFSSLATVPTADVWRMGTDNQQVGLRRQVLIMPNGHARLGASRLEP